MLTLYSTLAPYGDWVLGYYLGWALLDAHKATVTVHLYLRGNTPDSLRDALMDGCTLAVGDQLLHHAIEVPALAGLTRDEFGVACEVHYA